MQNNKQKKYESRIKQIKDELQGLEDMRPGSLTKQIYRRKDYERPYWQISYTLNRQSKTEYVRDDFVDKLRTEIAEYKKFKDLTTEWVDLAIKLSKEKIKTKNDSS